jgi:hypothetical protein
MKVRYLALPFVTLLLAACGGNTDDDPSGYTTPTNEELAADHCDAFSKGSVPVVNGTASPLEVIAADAIVKEMKLGPVEEPGGYIGEATLHVEEAGRYAFVVYEDPPTPSVGISFFDALTGGPEPTDFQHCTGCFAACEAVSESGSYDLAAGDYRFFIRNDSYSTVRFVLAPVAAP